MPIALIAAMMASIGIHAAALFLPEVELSPAPEPLPLQAEIVLQPRRIPVATKPAPKPAPVRPQPKSPTAKPVDETPPLALPPQETAPAEATAVATEAATPPPDLTSPELPPTGRIAYQVLSGDSHTVIGSAEQRWQIGGGRYRITQTMETTGLAALLRSVRVDTESSGLMTDNGLQPEEYVLRRSGRERVDQVRFDWPAGLARFGNGSEAKLPAGAQDLLSFNYQLGWLAKTGDMAIATGRKLGNFRLELVGREWVETPAGQIWTLHFRAAGETTTEVWLASEQHLLPVKIRHIDKKGERYEQLAEQIELDTP